MKLPSRILGLDPGSDKTGWCAVRTEGGIEIVGSGHIDNWDLLKGLHDPPFRSDQLVIEGVQWYGPDMHAGQVVFDTCEWIGMFHREWLTQDPDDLHYDKIYPKDIKLVLCGMSSKVKKKQIRQRLIDRFGGAAAIGGLKCSTCKGKGWYGAGRPTCPNCEGRKYDIPPGPLHAVTTHAWSALAAIVAWCDQRNETYRMETRCSS